MIILALPRGASVAVCDMDCLAAVASTFHPGTPILEVDDWPTCVTCYACTLVLPAPGTCPCEVLDVSCSRLSWALSDHPRLALEAIHDALGIRVVLTDRDWDRLMALGEEVTSGALAGALWAREQADRD